MRNRLPAAFLLVALISSAHPAAAGAQTNLDVSAAKAWVDTGVDLKRGELVSITATGQWTNGGAQPQWVGPAGFPGISGRNLLAPRLPLAALIGRVGKGTFLIGSRYDGEIEADGRLFVSINDASNAFGDNAGSIHASIEVRSKEVLAGSQLLPPSTFAGAEFLQGAIFTAFSGGRLQLSQTGEGVPLINPLAPASSQEQWSYLMFGPNLKSQGVQDFPIDLGPILEFSPEQFTNSFGWTIAAQFLVFHNMVFIDRMRFLINNIHANFDESLSVLVTNGEIVLNLKLPDKDSAIRGEGNGFTSLPFLIPIPLGWEDGLFPDFAMHNMTVAVHLEPFVDSGKVRLQNPKVAFPEGTLTLSMLDSLVEDKKKDFLEQARTHLEKELSKKKVKDTLELMVANLLLNGKENKNVSAITIDETGARVTFNR